MPTSKEKMCFWINTYMDNQQLPQPPPERKVQISKKAKEAIARYMAVMIGIPTIYIGKGEICKTQKVEKKDK